MLRLSVLAAGLTFVTITAAQAQVPGPAPKILLVESVAPDKGVVTVTVEKMVTELVPVTVEEKVVVNGVEMTVTRTTFQSVNKVIQIKQAWNASSNKAFDSGGQPLGKEELFKRLKVGDAVLVLAPGQKLAPAFQRLLSKEAVILEIAGGGM